MHIKPLNGPIAAMLACLVASTIAQQAPSQPVPRFQGGVDLVTLDVSVLDSNRIPVRGLTAADFTVLQDGRPQAITTFSAVDSPDAAEEAPVAWMREVQPDTSSNDRESERRILALVLDDATPMPAEEVPRVKSMARQVIERLGPDDLAAVVFAFNKKGGQEFTSDRVRLLAAVDRFNGSIDSMPILGAFDPDPTKSMSVSVPFDQYSPNALQMYSSVISTLQGLAERLSELPERRKALIFASVGLPFDVEQAQAREISLTEPTYDGPGGAQMLFSDLQKALEAAQRANVNIYGLDPGGLRAPTSRYDALAGKGTLNGSPGKLSRDFLQALSASTGGFTLGESNGFDAGITQIFRENASYYLLGYVRPDPRVDGKFRRVEVRVNRPGVTVRARNGYFEPRAQTRAAGLASPSSAAESAFGAIVAKADLAMRVTAAAFAVPGRREVALAVTVALRHPVPAAATRTTDEVEVLVGAYGPGGERRAFKRLQTRLALAPGTSEETIAFEVLSQIDLAPGPYQLRLAAHTSVQDKSGSVYCDVDVPDFSKVPLALSGVAIGVKPGMIAALKDSVASLVPITPTTVREFTAGDEVTAFLRVYQGGNGVAAPVAVIARILDSQDAKVFETSETLGPDRFAKARAADYSLTLPITTLKSGSHLLTIETKAGGKTARRDVRFEVRGW
jgi:VWFA-related protein